MTIFLKIAKQFITEEIKKIQSDSLAADESSLNAVLTFFHYGRDTELSAEKRQLLDDLMPQIMALTEDINDETSLLRLTTFITDCRENAALKSAEKQYDEGVFGTAMQNVETLLKRVYEKIRKLGLLDTPQDEDPLNEFRYYAAMYCVKNVVKTHRLTLWESLIEHPKVTGVRAFSKQKEDLVVEILHVCNQQIKVLDINHDLYKVSRKERVLECIDKLRTRNRRLCDDPGTGVKLPGVGLNLPGSHPSYGFLETCMENAIAAIDKKEAPIKPVKASSEADLLRRGSDASRKAPGTGTSTPVSLVSSGEAEARKEMVEEGLEPRAVSVLLPPEPQAMEASAASPPAVVSSLKKEGKEPPVAVAPDEPAPVSAMPSATTETLFSNAKGSSKKKKGAQQAALVDNAAAKAFNA